MAQRYSPGLFRANLDFVSQKLKLMLFSLAFAIDIVEGTTGIVENLLVAEETFQLYFGIRRRVTGMDDVLLVAHRVIASDGSRCSLTSVGGASHSAYHLYGIHAFEGERYYR